MIEMRIDRDEEFLVYHSLFFFVHDVSVYYPFVCISSRNIVYFTIPDVPLLN